MRCLVNTDLAIDVGSGVQQHLDHGLITANTGVHEGGHSLETEREGGMSQASVWTTHLHTVSNINYFGDLLLLLYGIYAPELFKATITLNKIYTKGAFRTRAPSEIIACSNLAT